LEEAMKPVKTYFGIITTVTGIELVSRPTKLTYTEGDTLDFTGLSIKVLYDDGSEKLVTADDCTFSTTTASKANTRVNVTYEGFTKYFRITVNTATTETPVTPTPGTPNDGNSSSSGSSSSNSSSNSSTTPSSSANSSSETSKKKKGCKGELTAGSIALIALLPACGYVVCRLFRKKSD
jgi:hypothetical protein